MNNVTVLKNEDMFEGKLTNLFSMDGYKNEFGVITDHGGTVLCAGWVSVGDLSTIGQHQARVADLDSKHADKLQSQIQQNGLSRLPYVEWCENDKQFKILDGHHRIQAMTAISQTKYKHKTNKSHLVRVCVVSFQDVVKREIFKQVQNNKHEESKTHDHRDAAPYLQRLIAMGYKNWDTRQTDESQINKLQKEAYDALDQAMYCLNGRQKNRIFYKSFNSFSRDTIRYVESDAVKEKARITWNVDSLHDKWQNDEYYCCGSQTSILKQLYIAMSKRAEDAMSGKINLLTHKKGKIRISTYFGASESTADDLRDRREKVLNRFKMNNIVFHKDVALIEEVMFEPQFRSADGSVVETKMIKYIWSHGEKDFIQQ